MRSRWDFRGDEGCLTKSATARVYPGHAHSPERVSGGITTLRRRSYLSSIGDRRSIEHECERSSWSTSRRLYSLSGPAVVSARHGSSPDTPYTLRRELRGDCRAIPVLGSFWSDCSHHRGPCRCRKREARQNTLRHRQKRDIEYIPYLSLPLRRTRRPAPGCAREERGCVHTPETVMQQDIRSVFCQTRLISEPVKPPPGP